MSKPCAAGFGSEAPWLTPEIQELVVTLCACHQRAFSRPLIAAARSGSPCRLLAQELFAASTVVLAHDGADPTGDPGPHLIYANRAALQLWQRPWAELVGMPSRLTAEPAERAGRARALASVRRQHAIANYTGVRIDSQGCRFQICGARVWSLPCGQAAAFSAWHWL